MKINDYMISEKEKDQCSLISAGKPGRDSPTQACSTMTTSVCCATRMFWKNAGLFQNHLLTLHGFRSQFPQYRMVLTRKCSLL